ncbi:MAG: oxidoreductase, partial [Muribaculaceae bacterium]|nr:oxidoreductase [Muribaculaceae bacterium]
LDPTRRYPMLMQPERAARLIVKAIDRRRRVAVIDTRWLWLVGLWRLIPSWLWARLPIKLAL